MDIETVQAFIRGKENMPILHVRDSDDPKYKTIEKLVMDINPKTEDLGMVLAIFLVSSLLSLIEPNSVIEICLAALAGSFPLIIIVNASLIANVAITTSTKLIPSDKFIVLKVNLGMSDKVSCPTVASINPNTHIIIAFKKLPLDENAATAVKPKIIKPK